MKLKKLLIAALAGALLLSGCSTSGSGKTAVQVGDSVITDNAIKFMAEYCMGTPDVSGAEESLQQCYLIKEIADKMGITLDDDETKEIKQEIASFKANEGGKTAGDKLLKSFGLDDDILMTIASTSSYAQKIFEQITIDDPTDDELLQYFKDSYLRAKHVLIMTQDSETGEDFDDEKMAEAEQQANEILEKAKGGANFDDLIKEYGEDPGMSSNEDGYFFTDGQMVTEFEDATKSIQPGEFTLCKSTFGYHIIQRLAIDESDPVVEEYFNDNKTSIQSSYASKQQQDALDKKAEELGITVETNQDVIDSIVLEDVSTADAE
jgi:parvulin-like peptidyl-prolyl isomerase